MFGGGISRAQADKSYGKVNAPNVATRIVTGRLFNTTNLGTNTTFHQAFELAQHFDAVRPIFAEIGTAFSGRMNLGKASVSDTFDTDNSAGTWTSLTGSGLAGPFMFPAASASTRPTYWMPDWLPLKSIPRTDGGTKPVVHFRVQIGGDVFMTSYGDGTDTFTNWATRPGGKFLSRLETGDKVTDPSTFTSTTNLNYGPIVGVQYLARGKVLTMMSAGNSITEGRTTYKGEGFILPAVEALSDPDNIAIELMQLGWTGQSYAQITERAIDMMESELRPDIIIVPTGSPNDELVTLTAAGIARTAANRGRILQAAAARQIVPVLWTWLPSDTSARPYGSSDALRVADNAAAIAAAATGGKVLIADTATAFSGSTSGGQVQIGAGLSSDGIHPNATGNTALQAIIQPVLAKAAKGVLGGGYLGASRPRKGDWPVFITRGAAVLSTPGTYVYAGSGAGGWSIPSIAASGRQAGSQRYTVINHGTAAAAVLTITGSSSTFNSGGVAGLASVTLNPGESADITNNGTSWTLLRHTMYAKRGTATLVGGTVTVADTSITATSKISLRSTTLGGTPGALYVSAKTASTSFAITSTSGTDTSVVEYTIERY